MCAEASNPVIVYCAMSRPVEEDVDEHEAGRLPSPKPDALTVSVNTYRSDWCWSGTMRRIATITTTPTMCQYAETVLRSAVTLTFSRFRAAAAARKMT